MLYIVNEMTFKGYNVVNIDLSYIIAILSGILLIIRKNPVVSVLFLIGLFLGISAYLILTWLNFAGSAGIHKRSNQLQLSSIRHCTIFHYKLPWLYKVMDFLLTMLISFYSYLYMIGLKLQNKLEKNFPIFYSITLYIYSEYCAIIRGDLSKNMNIIIGLYVVFYYSNLHLILYSLLILNAFLKKHIIKDIWLKDNFPILYRILLDISSFINTIIIFYFLDLIFINIIKPYLLKVWNGILKMASSNKGNVDTGGLSNKGNMPNPQKPSGTSVIDPDKDSDKKNKEKLKKEFDRFHKANIEFNSADRARDKDSHIILKDIVDDYSQYLPEDDRNRLLTLLSTKYPKFQLDYEDTVHQFWLNKRASNRPGWDNTLEIIGIFAKNSKSIQQQLGGKKSYKSELFRKETEQFKMTWSVPHKRKESIIKRELEQARAFDKLLKENGFSIKQLIDSIDELQK